MEQRIMSALPYAPAVVAVAVIQYGGVQAAAAMLALPAKAVQQAVDESEEQAQAKAARKGPQLALKLPSQQ
jgi:hypothetical protein